jgi:hypothetical protein
MLGGRNQHQIDSAQDARRLAAENSKNCSLQRILWVATATRGAFVSNENRGAHKIRRRQKN